MAPKLKPPSKMHGVAHYFYHNTSYNVTKGPCNASTSTLPISPNGEGGTMSSPMIVSDDKPDSGRSDDNDVIELDPLEGLKNLEAAKKHRRSYELHRHFQDNWAAKLPWAEAVVGVDRAMTQVKCIVCSAIDGREKLLVAKIDSLWKHAGRRKADKDLVVGKKVTVKSGEYYFLKDCQHVKNEKIYFGKERDTIQRQVAHASTVERRKKLVQFTCLFHLLSQGRPMTEYETMFGLLVQLKTPDVPRKHWCDNSGWEMAEAMCTVVDKHTRNVLTTAKFISLSADEVTSIDNQSWLSCHAYVMENWTRKSMLLRLVRVVNGCTAENLTNVIVDATIISGLAREQLGKKLICFGADGDSIFQGCTNGVTVQLQKMHAPYLLAMHCCAHHTNLVVKNMSDLSTVAKLEDLCQCLYSYFSHSPKRHLEFTRLADIMETEGNKILRNVKSQWISLLDPLDHILKEYKTLIVKMDEDAPTMAVARANLAQLLDIQTLFSLPCILPLLVTMNYLIKFAQRRDVYIVDYIATVKTSQAELYYKYVDSTTCFKPENFCIFHDLVMNHSCHMSHEWVTDLNDHSKYLSFKIGDHSYPSHFVNLVTGKEMPVNEEDFEVNIVMVKGQCKEAIEMLIDELEKHFPDSELLNALGIVFPQYWLQTNSECAFSDHLTIICSHFCESRRIGVKCVEEPLNGQLLIAQQCYFKMTMQQNAAKIMEETSEINPLSRLWRKLGANSLLCMRISEWFRLAEIAVVAVIGSVEDERTFSTMSFMKGKLRNQLGTHLDCSVKLYAQNFWNIQSFPFQEVITTWMNEKDRLGTGM